MTFAIIQTGGKQYKVKEGDKVKIEKLPQTENEEVIFDQVLLVSDDKKLKVGTPTVAGAQVKATLIKQGRGKKITVIHYKAKVRHQKTNGHRQPFTEVQIEKIS